VYTQTSMSRAMGRCDYARRRAKEINASTNPFAIETYGPDRRIRFRSGRVRSVRLRVEGLLSAPLHLNHECQEHRYPEEGGYHSPKKPSHALLIRFQMGFSALDLFGW
jgi:hypothetical protein